MVKIVRDRPSALQRHGPGHRVNPEEKHGAQPGVGGGGAKGGRVSRCGRPCNGTLHDGEFWRSPWVSAPSLAVRRRGTLVVVLQSAVSGVIYFSMPAK